MVKLVNLDIYNMRNALKNRLKYNYSYWDILNDDIKNKILEIKKYNDNLQKIDSDILMDYLISITNNNTLRQISLMKLNTKKKILEEVIKNPPSKEFVKFHSEKNPKSKFELKEYVYRYTTLQYRPNSNDDVMGYINHSATIIIVKRDKKNVYDNNNNKYKIFYEFYNKKLYIETIYVNGKRVYSNDENKQVNSTLK